MATKKPVKRKAALPAKPPSRKRKSAVALPTSKQQAAALVRFQEQLAQENAGLLREGYAAGLAIVVRKVKKGNNSAFDKLLSIIDRAEQRGAREMTGGSAPSSGDSSAQAAYTLEELTKVYRRRVNEE